MLLIDLNPKNPTELIVRFTGQDIWDTATPGQVPNGPVSRVREILGVSAFWPDGGEWNGRPLQKPELPENVEGMREYIGNALEHVERWERALRDEANDLAARQAEARRVARALRRAHDAVWSEDATEAECYYGAQAELLPEQVEEFDFDMGYWPEEYR